MWAALDNIGKKRCCTISKKNLDRIRIGINKAYKEIMDKNGYVSAQK